MSSLDAGTAAALEQVMSRDPEAPVRRIASLSRIIGKALAAEQFEIAASVADVALRIHPESLPLLDAASEAREGRGDRTNAADLAAKCAATPSTNDWRTSATIAHCRAAAYGVTCPRCRLPLVRSLRSGSVVTCCGRICYQRRKINLSQVFAGQKVGVKQTAEHIWLVSFMDYDLGYFDDETCRLEPIEDPFGPRLSPMSPE